MALILLIIEIILLLIGLGYLFLTKSLIDKKTIIFSILTGNSTAPTWKTRQLLDKMMAVIAEAN